MSLLEKASLIVTPNAYKESKLYSVIPSDGSGDMDVVRATTATRVNSAGLIEVVPRNLLTYSNDFTNAVWTKANASISNNVIASPNGNIDANKLIEDTANSSHYFRSDFTLVNSGSTYTYSIFAKKAERNFTVLFDSYINSGYWFDLNNGIVGSKYGTGAVTANIENFGNGWYKCSITFTAHSGGYALLFNNVTNADNVISYTGNGTSGIYIYGAQLEQGSTATEYFPTTTRLNIPRIDYTNGSCPSLLVEPQRTNLLTYSNNFLSNWGSDGTTTITANSGISPDGTNNATKVITVGATGYGYRILPTISAGNYTYSLYIKSSTNTNINIAINDVGGSGIVQINIPVSNNWQRFSVSANITNGTFVVIDYSALVLGIDYYFYGAQAEQGSYATSYIPTVATSVTRNADIISKTGISSLIGQTEGTVFMDFNNQLLSSTLLCVNKNSTNGLFLVTSSSGSISARVYANSVNYTVSNTGYITLNQKIKVCFKYGFFGLKLFINGELKDTNISSIVFTSELSSLNFNDDLVLNGNELIYNNSTQLYKTALSDTECINLTTI